MSILSSMSGPNKSQRRKRIAIVTGVAALALIPVLQSTFAANIALNDNASIEFGQGVQATLACDASVTLTPTASFQNDSSAGGTGTFVLQQISLVSNDSQHLSDVCGAATFTVTPRKADGSALAIYKFTILHSGSTYSVVPVLINSATDIDELSSADQDTITIYDYSQAIATSLVAKITIETN